MSIFPFNFQLPELPASVAAFINHVGEVFDGGDHKPDNADKPVDAETNCDYVIATFAFIDQILKRVPKLSQFCDIAILKADAAHKSGDNTLAIMLADCAITYHKELLAIELVIIHQFQLCMYKCVEKHKIEDVDVSVCGIKNRQILETNNLCNHIRVASISISTLVCHTQLLAAEAEALIVLIRCLD
jgi:hypothetical protein